jgi:hypothetical protein
MMGIAKHYTLEERIERSKIRKQKELDAIAAKRKEFFARQDAIADESYDNKRPYTNNSSSGRRPGRSSIMAMAAMLAIACGTDRR